ncbi:MAG: serine/threonine-protein kinase, partial [Acidobacteriota bacterium]
MERIGKYEVLDQIGSGGFATVYKGYDPFIKRPVAIKVCNSRDEESRQRFYREAEIVGSLQHRNITAVYDFGVHDDQPYLVEEYLPGEDLAHMVRRQEPSDLAQRLDFLVQIASGLEFAHKQGVIHRDIKPSNVRVLGDGRIKIMDFGTAKLAHVESNLTQAGMTLGTVAYLSPERLLGNPSGTNSDIFSYGVLAYEVLSFRRPFAGRNIPNLIDQVLNAAPTPLADNWPECPPKLAEIVHRCLFKDPTVRYASCGDVLMDLERVIVDNTGRVPVGLLNESSGSLSIQQTTVQVSGLIERARSLIKSGRHSRAELMLEEVLEIAPKNAEARQL